MDSGLCPSRQAVTFTEITKTGRDWDRGWGELSQRGGCAGRYEKCKFYFRHVELEMPLRQVPLRRH